MLRLFHQTLIVNIKLFVIIFITLSFANSAVSEAADIEVGKKVFKLCAVCHYADRNQNKIGPTLFNLMGRKAGTVAGYHYSAAMTKAGDNGLVWTNETLKQYLHAPQQLVKGTLMASIRITNDAYIDDLIAYLESVSGN